METQLTGSEQKVKENARMQQLQKVWLSRLTQEEKDHNDMRKVMRGAGQNFNADLKDGDSLYIPLYWMVCNVEHVGIYSNSPVPDVRPRNEQNNKTFNNVARMIQRALMYCVDNKQFDDCMHRTIDDYLSVGLGLPRVKIQSVIVEEETGETDFFNQPKKEERVADQKLGWQYVPWARFGWMPCNSWEDCDWIYFRHRMTQAQIKRRFGRAVSASKDKHDKDGWMKKTYDIYEIWDKINRKVLFVAKGESMPLEVVDDPLELLNFYPCPCPMFMNLPSEELIPKPDYCFIEHYDKELNRLQERRMGLVEQIKSAGAYDKGLSELSGMLDLEDGELLAIQNLAQRIGAAGGTEGLIYWLPIQEKIEALMQITQQMQVIKSQVDEILGISDIVMGVTKASESATAQDIKGRWVGIRLTRKRECVQFTIAEMMRIMAQLLGSHITPDNLQRMTQMQMTDEMMEIFMNDTLMDFIIDIETESTVAKDEKEERRAHQEMLNAIAQFSQSVLPMVQQNMLPADVSTAILKTALKPYTRYDRGLEEALVQLPTSQQQLKKLSGELQQTNQKLQQSEGQAQQWQQLAQKLQMEATAAKNAKLHAETGKTKVETVKLVGEMKDDKLQPLKTAAEVGKIVKETEVLGKPMSNSYRR